MEIKSASIQQINIAYHAVEDRLLLKIGFSDDAELAIWLTRRLVKNLWRLLQAETPLPSASSIAGPEPESEQGFDKHAANAAAPRLDFSSEYRSRQLFDGKEVLLAKDCQLVKSADLHASLEMVCTNGQVMKLLLTPELALALTNMLQLVARETAWELALSGPTPMLTTLQTSSVLH